MSTCRGYCGRRQVQREGTEGAGCTNVPSHVDAPEVKNEGSATGASFLKGQAHRWPPVMRGWQRVQDEHAERRGLDCGRCSGDRRNLPDAWNLIWLRRHRLPAPHPVRALDVALHSGWRVHRSAIHCGASISSRCLTFVHRARGESVASAPRTEQPALGGCCATCLCDLMLVKSVQWYKTRRATRY